MVRMNQCRMTLLAERGLVEVAGPDAMDFLQGLITNDVDLECEGEATFAGLLTPQGKILFDFFIVARPAATYWLDCQAAQADALAKRLGMYKLRAKLAIANRTGELGVAAVWGDEPLGDKSALAALYCDPRLAALGSRAIFPPAEAASLAAKLGVEIVDADVYRAHRVALMVPEGGADYAYGEAFPHEAAYDELNGVDFEKGCYVGQEVVSRMHHRGTAKTRIAGFEATAPIASGAEILAGELPVGTVGSVNGLAGIATVRLDRAEEAMQHGTPLVAGGIAVTLRQPSWAHYKVPTAGGGGA